MNKYYSLLLILPYIILPFIKGGRGAIVWMCAQFFIAAAVGYSLYQNKEKSLIGTKVDVFIILLFLWCAFAAIAGSVNILSSISALMSFLVYMFLAIALLNIPDFEEFKISVVISISAIGIIFSILIISGYLFGRNIIIFTNQNHTALYLLLSFWNTIFIIKRFNIKLILGITAVIVLFCALIIIGSRGVFFSLWLTILILLFFIDLRIERYKVIFGFIFITIALFAAAPKKTLYNNLKIDSAMSFRRVEIYKTAFKVIGENYMYGVGLNNFESGYEKHKLPFWNGISAYNHYSRFAHNELLNLISETGIPAFIIFLYLTLYFYYLWRKERYLIKDYFPLILIISICAHSMFEFVLHLPIIMMILIFSVVWFFRENSIAVRHYNFKRDKFAFIAGIAFAAIVIINTGFKVYYSAPDSINLHKEGLNDYIGGNTFSAIKKLKNSMELNPYRPFMYIDLANIYFEMKSYNEALRTAKKAISIEPNYLSAYFTIGLCYYKLNKFDVSERYLNRILEIHSGIDFSKITSDYDKEILNIQIWQVYSALGSVLESRGDYSKSITALNHSVLLNGNNSELYNKLAGAYYNMKQYQLALSSIDQAIKLNPENIGYRNNLENIKRKI
ncbi:MAG: tetratricopeptide repeat protein [Elusimicrobiota bacterium]